ncbi:MAG: nucleotidyltransferase family protein [Thiobacillus sp.]|nr:nucleotidyltransferase family protein [Thiobacillus sp.]
MRPTDALLQHRESIRRIVLEHHARNPRIFGSVLHGSDTEDSDLDILVDDTPETSLLDLACIERQLSALLGITVDVRTPPDLPKRFREQVLAEAKPL